MRHLTSTNSSPFSLTGSGFVVGGSAGDLSTLKLFEGGFDLLEIEAANAANFDHRNDAGACPIPEAAAGDIELLGSLLRGEQFRDDGGGM